MGEVVPLNVKTALPRDEATEMRELFDAIAANVAAGLRGLPHQVRCLAAELKQIVAVLPPIHGERLSGKLATLNMEVDALQAALDALQSALHAMSPAERD